LTEDRYSRQRKLAEVGDTGQARIEGATFEVRGQDGDDIERAYLERAGARAVVLTPDAPAAPFRHAGHFRFPATQSVGAGAWRALAHLRSLLTGALPPRLADATAPPPPSAGSLRSRSSAPPSSLGDDEFVDAELLKDRRS
jgi:hypothetical protein